MMGTREGLVRVDPANIFLIHILASHLKRPKLSFLDLQMLIK